MCMCASVWICVHESMCPLSPEEDVSTSGVLISCELPNLGAERWSQVLVITESFLPHNS